MLEDAEVTLSRSHLDKPAILEGDILGLEVQRRELAGYPNY